MRIFDNTNTSIGKLAVRVRSPTTILSPREGPAAGVGDKSPAAAFTDGLLAACMYDGSCVLRRPWTVYR